MRRPINNTLRVLLIAAGTISLGLGILGIVVPILPTTPFLLLTAFCYARSSKRFYNLLLNNKYLGTYIRNYLLKKGVSVKVKLYATIFLWSTIIVSLVLISANMVVQIVLIVIAISVTVHILCLKTLY
jgi:uncharacterized membrane protein YbaN (DUF454 family)